jgi:ferric enterobactin receptor
MKHVYVMFFLLSCSFIVRAQQSVPSPAGNKTAPASGRPAASGTMSTAASKLKISGRIVDSVSKSPVESATITLYMLHNVRPVKGLTADSKGGFIVEGLAPGSYTLSVGGIGFQTRVFGPFILSVKTPALPLGDILMTKKAEDLASVTVTAPRGLVENKIDKMVYNAERDITSQGGVATDILKKVPMVSVDVDGNVQLMGNSNILFLINGKPSSTFGNNLADALQSIPASQIKSIEVITSPGAKYDAEGTGGIINIILKENKLRGINGNISLTGGSRLENGSLNLNARKNNFGMNAFFSGNGQLRSTTNNTSDRVSEDTVAGTTERLLQQGHSTFTRHGYQSGLGFDWNIDHRNNLSGNVGYSYFGNHSTGISNQEQAQSDASGATLSDLFSLIQSKKDFVGKSLDWSVNYKKTFAQEDRELNIAYQSSFGTNNSFYSQGQSLPSGDSLFAGSYSNNNGKDQETNFRLDYAQPLSDKVKLETGGRVQMRHITSISDVYTLDASTAALPYFYDTSQSNSLKYDRHVYAAYGSLSFPLGTWLDVKGGVRYERTETNAGFSKAGNINIPGYNTFSPSLFLSHNFPGDQILKIGYTRRLRRPDYGSLNPYVNASDPKNLSTGNPYLAPQIANNVDLTYSKSFEKGASLNVVFFYHRSDHDIQPYITYYPSYTIGDSTYTNVSVNQPVNIGSENDYGLNIYGAVPIGRKLNIRSNVSFFDRYITLGALSSVTSFNYRANLNATYQVSGTLILEFFGDFNSSRNEIQGKYPSWTSYNFAFRKQIWNKKGSIAFTTTNPFANYVTQKTAISGQDFTLNSSRQIPFRSFGLNFTYKFGKLEFKKEKEKEKEDSKEPVIPTENNHEKD